MSTRAEVVRADLERIGRMSAEEFAEQWGEWARRQDRDVTLVQERWVSDLTHAVGYAEREADAVAHLVAAKTAYRDDPTPENKTRRDDWVRVVQEIRAAERHESRTIGPAGDAFVVGTNPALENGA